ncbi:MAG: cation transporter [Hahellaceae bacterium]|nr:cation transporter [Hahellaceae bacterium]
MNNHEQASALIHDRYNPEHARIAQKVTLQGMVLDILIGLGKIVTGHLSFSHALVADGLHSLSDAVTDILVIAVTRYSRQEPDDQHPYGHERFETLGTVFLGCLLIGVAGAMVWDSWIRLFELKTSELPTWPALVLALISIVTKEAIFRYTLHYGKKIKSDLVIANAWHSRSDAFSSIVVFVAVGGAMLGYLWLDLLAAIVVALMIGKVGWDLSWDSVKQLVDTALSPEETKRMRAFIEKNECVRSVHDLRSRYMGQHVLIDVHLLVDPAISVSEGHQIGLIVTRELKQEFPSVYEVTFHIDAEMDEGHYAPYAPMAKLPLRPEALDQLQICWQELIPKHSASSYRLHYLNEKISIEIFLKEGAALDISKEALRNAARDIPWLGEIRLWIQSL